MCLVNNPRLDPGITLPFPALHDEIFFKHPKAHRQRAHITIRPQPQIDPKYNSIARDLTEESGNSSADLRKEGARIN